MPDRTWLWNLSRSDADYTVVHTLISKDFKKFVLDSLSKSEQMHVNKKNTKSKSLLSSPLCLKCQDDFQVFLDAWVPRIRENGRFSKLLSIGKKWRRYEMEEDKSSLSVDKIKQQLNSKQRIIEQLKSEVDKFERERIHLLDDQTKLVKLYHTGLIDDRRDPIPHNQNESDDMG